MRAVLPLWLSLALCGPVSLWGQDSAPTITLERFTISPSPFSPAFSPGEKDAARWSYWLNRAAPVFARIYQGEQPICTVPSPELADEHTSRRSSYDWTGRGADGQPLPDGIYEVRLYTAGRFKWRLGEATTLGQQDEPQPGVLVRPRSLAVQPNGTLFVSPSGSPLLVFDAGGNFLRFLAVTLEGTNRQLTGFPRMALAPTGHLIVLDDAGLVDIDLSGKAKVLVPRRSADWGPLWELGLAVCPDGRILVAQGKKQRIDVYSAEGSEAGSIGGQGAFSGLMDVAVGPDGLVYVLDSKGVQVFRPDGTAVRRVSLKGADAGGGAVLSGRAHLAVLADGSLVVAREQMNLALEATGHMGSLPPEVLARMQSPQAQAAFDLMRKMPVFYRYGADGKLLASWGSTGGAVGQFCEVTDVAARGNRIYACDGDGNNRVVVMDGGGQVLQTIETPPDRLVAPTGIARLSDGGENVRYVVADRELDRCVVFGPDGKVRAYWPTWTLGVMEAWAVFGDDRGHVYLPAGTDLLITDDRGILQRTVRLGWVPRDPIFHWGGLYPYPDGRLLMSSEARSLGAPGEEELGRLRLFGADGNLLQTIGEGPPCYWGPICAVSDTQAWVQASVADAEGTERVEVVPIDLASCTLGRGVVLPQRADFGGFSCVPGPEFHKAFTCYGAAGQVLWHLESDMHPEAVLRDKADVLYVCAIKRHGWVECWSVGEDIPLGVASVEIDNTPPMVQVLAPEGMVTTGDGPLVLRGTATDRNFKQYKVYYRPAEGDRTEWDTIRYEAITTPCEPGGVLIEWQVPRGLRNTGVFVKVVAEDTAGNTNEAAPVELVFDDDGDGLSNTWEVANGADPQQPTLQGCRAEIEGDLEAFLRPYLRADTAYELKLTIYDVTAVAEGATDTEAQSRRTPLSGARVQVEATSGTLPTSPEGRYVVHSWRDGRVPVEYTTPAVQAGQLLFVTIRATLAAQVVNNRCYEPTDAEFTVMVCRDDDDDWRADGEEVAVSQDDHVRPLRGNRDSDGDGVIDGFDICPRTTYDDDWSTVYQPGMLRFEQQYAFHGIGGSESKSYKDGEDLGLAYIVRTPQIDDSAAMKRFVNEIAFSREDPDPAKRSPFAIAFWRVFGQDSHNTASWLTETSYGKGRYKFKYHSEDSYGTAVIENVDPVDMSRPNAPKMGIHRGYLRAQIPACDERVPRTLTIQWRNEGWDRTTGPDAHGRYTKMAWLVEAFPNENLLQAELLYSNLAVAVPADPALHLYEAVLEFPAEALPPGVNVSLKLTPCWVKHDPAKGEGSYELEAEGVGGLKVSGVQVTTPTGCVLWLRRMMPRPGRPLDWPTFRQVVERAEAVGTWPPEDQVAGLDVTVNGITYHVVVVSVYRMPATLDASARAERIRTRAVELASQLPQADAIAIVASSPHDRQALLGQVDWGTDGSWVDMTQAEQEGTQAAEEGGEGGILDTAIQVAKAGASFAAWGKKCYDVVSKVSDIAKWHRYTTGADTAQVTPGKTGDWWTGENTYYDWETNPSRASEELPMAARSYRVRKLAEGQYEVECEKTRWFYKPAPDGKATARRVSKTIIQRQRVDHLSESDLLMDDPGVGGTPQYKRAKFIKDVAPYLKAGACLVSNGLQVYALYKQDDMVGVVLYSTKTLVELGEPAVELAGRFKAVKASSKFKALQESAVFKGVNLSKGGATRVSVVAVVTGVLEISYYTHKLYSAETRWDKEQAAQNMYAAFVDTSIAAVEPWGGIILLSWTVSATATEFIMEKAGLEVSPLTKRVCASPGSALAFIITDLFTDAIPSELVKDAADDAVKQARANVDVYNKRNDGYMYIFVGPKDAKY